jgi:hypothetical protein
LRKIAICLCIFLLLPIQTRPSSPTSNKEIFESVISFAYAHQLIGEKIDVVVASIGKYFINTPYTEKSLDRDSVEHLVVNLKEFDCTTFVESVLALARCVSGSKTTFSDFENELVTIRYRGGELRYYASRLHYFSEWIFDNSRKKIIEDVTRKSGGTETSLKLNFMSTHFALYPQLKLHPAFIDSMRTIEKRVSGNTLYEIPKTQIAACEKEINSGDIIAIATDVKGLDISHVGIAIRGDNGRIYLLHASSSAQKVKVSETPLADYLSKHNHDTGIIILRPLIKP